MLKAIALDLDGTTLDSSNRISSRTKAAIEAARNKGIAVVIVSGRHHGTLHPYHAELSLDTPAICCNGTYLYDFVAHRALDGSSFSAEEARALLAASQAYGIHLLFYADDWMNYEISTAHLRKLEAWAAGCPEPVRPGIRHVENFETVIGEATNLWKFVASHEQPEPLAAWARDMGENKRLNVEYSWINRVDAMPAGNSKGSRLLQWAASQGIVASEIMAIGDNHNDISMIRSVGLGIAMGNAEAEVKAVAKEVTAGNDDEGVAMAIERFAL